MADIHFVWSSEEYKLFDVVRLFSFPIIIRVTKGYYDGRHKDTLKNDNIIFLKCIDKEIRILTKDVPGKTYYCIPKSYPYKFTSPGQRGPKTLSEILSSTPTPFNINPVEKLYTSDATEAVLLQLNELIVLKQYYDHYMKANAIAEGKIRPDIHIIPRFTRARVKVATGLKGQGESQWKNYINDLLISTRRLNYDAVIQTQSILMYPANKIKDQRKFEENVPSTPELSPTTRTVQDRMYPANVFDLAQGNDSDGFFFLLGTSSSSSASSTISDATQHGGTEIKNQYPYKASIRGNKIAHQEGTHQNIQFPRRSSSKSSDDSDKESTYRKNQYRSNTSLNINDSMTYNDRQYRSTPSLMVNDVRHKESSSHGSLYKRKTSLGTNDDTITDAQPKESSPESKRNFWLRMKDVSMNAVSQKESSSPASQYHKKSSLGMEDVPLNDAYNRESARQHQRKDSLEMPDIPTYDAYNKESAYHGSQRKASLKMKDVPTNDSYDKESPYHGSDHQRKTPLRNNVVPMNNAYDKESSNQECQSEASMNNVPSFDDIYNNASSIASSMISDFSDYANFENTPTPSPKNLSNVLSTIYDVPLRSRTQNQSGTSPTIKRGSHEDEMYDVSRRSGTRKASSTSPTSNVPLSGPTYYNGPFPNQDIQRERKKSASSENNYQQTNDSNFQSISEVPQNMTKLTYDDISQVLRLLSLDEYITKFRKDCIDGKTLQDMTKASFKKNYDFSEAQALRLHAFVKEGWRPK